MKTRLSNTTPTNKTIAPSIVLAIAICTLLSGCFGGNSRPDTHYYLLRSPAPEQQQLPQSLIQLKDVSVAPYLDQKGLVLEAQSNQIQVAHHHLWSEPLDQSIGLFLSQQLSAQYGAWIENGPQSAANYQLSVMIEKLHAKADGQVVLAARWQLLNLKTKKLHTYHAEKTAPLTADGYDAMVDSEKQLLKQLANAITLTLPKPQAITSVSKKP